MGFLNKKGSPAEALDAWVRRNRDAYKHIAMLTIYGLAEGETKDDWLVISRCQNAAWPAEQYPIAEFAGRLWAGALTSQRTCRCRSRSSTRSSWSRQASMTARPSLPSLKLELSQRPSRWRKSCNERRRMAER
jgi:hypothetical protein